MRTSACIGAAALAMLVAGCGDGGGGAPAGPVDPPPPPPASTPGVTVSVTDLTVDEGGEASYTVVLDSRPAGAVTVTPSSGDTGAVLVSGALTFTASNWNEAQTVTLRGVEENSADAQDETTTVTHAVSGYGAVTTAAGVNVKVADNDFPANGIYGSPAESGTDADFALAILHDGRIVGQRFVLETLTTSVFTGAYVVDRASLSGETRGIDIVASSPAFFENRPISGTIFHQTSLRLTTTDSGGGEVQLSLPYSDVNDRPSSLSSWGGTWAVIEEGESAKSLTVDAEGAFFGQDADGCTATGTLSILDADRNLYGLETAVESCGERNGDYTGFAWLDPPGGGDNGHGLMSAFTGDGRNFWGDTWSRAGAMPPPPPPADPLPQLSVDGCADGRYVPNPDSNAGLVGDCRALIGFAKALARNRELTNDHALRRWGAGTQTMLTRWAGIYTDDGRVAAIDLPRAGLRGALPAELGQLTGLTMLNLSYNAVTDLSPLAGLTGLTQLYLDGNAIADISPLAGLTGLTALTLESNNIADVSAVSGLTDLTVLYLGSNNIADISPLAGLTELIQLHLWGNSISDLSPLAGLTGLTRLYLWENSITDISPLAGMTELIRLYLEGNSIVDVTPLAGLTGLTDLQLHVNAIEDISALAGLTNLTRLALGQNSIADISPLAGLTGLTELYLHANAIADISPLAGLTGLTALTLGGNRITDVSPLVGLGNLTRLELASNAIEDLSPLVSDRGLGQVAGIDVTDNPLNRESLELHIPALTSRGLTVDYDLHLVDEFPDSRLVQIYNDNVIVMQVDENVADPRVLDAVADYTTDFYGWFEDEFDYLLLLSNTANGEYQRSFFHAGIYISATNDTQGLGLGGETFLDNRYGSAGRLRGIIHFPFHRFLRFGPSLHELQHAWSNYAVPTATGAHWGFSSANGQLGGFDIANLVNLGSGQWSAGSFGDFANGGNNLPYSPIELYFAGLATPDEVPDLWVAQDGAWLRDENGVNVLADNGNPVFTAQNVRTNSIEDIIARVGARNPSAAEVRRDQRAAAILLIDADHPPDSAVLRTMSDDAAWLGMQADDGTPLHNYHEATRGRGTLTLDGLAALRKDEPAAPANLPASFGTPPPPRMTTFEELCGPSRECAAGLPSVPRIASAPSTSTRVVPLPAGEH